MTGPEWTALVKSEIEAAGFTVTEVHMDAFPLVQQPETLEEKVRLMKLRLSVPVNRRIYAEGMMFLPVFPRGADAE